MMTDQSTDTFGGHIRLPRSVGIGVVSLLAAWFAGGVWYASESTFKIGELERRLAILEPAIQQEHQNSLEIMHLQKEQEQQDKRMDLLYGQLSILDSHGSRGLDRVESKQKDMIDELHVVENRLDKLDEQLRRLQSAKGGM